jgi:hypothetical protein
MVDIVVVKVVRTVHVHIVIQCQIVGVAIMALVVGFTLRLQLTITTESE